jgi:putative peptidoglycan lipid II flippase
MKEGTVLMSDFVRGAVKATAVVMFITLLSRVMGFVREMFIAATFGVGMVMDAYRMAALIPTILFSAIAAALGVTLIPVLSEYVHGKSTANTNRFINNTLNICLAVSALLMLIGIVASEQLVGFVAPGFSEEAARLTVRLIRIMFPMVLFNVIAVIATGYLQTYNRFFVPALSGLMFNLVIITQLSMFGGLGIDGLAAATILGMVLQGLIQIPFMFKTGYRYELTLDYKCEGLKKVFVLMLPVLMGTAISQVNVTVNQIIASGLPEGSISALDFGNRINGMVNSLFGLSIATVLYPSMARMAFGNQIEKLKKMVSTGIRVVSFITMPMMVGLMVLSVPIVRLLFERGAFDARATLMTSQALFYYALAIVPIGASGVLSRAFFSLQDTRTPVVVGLLSVSLNILLNLTIVEYMGHAGLALSTSISSSFSVFVSLLLFRRKMGLLGGRQLITSISKQIAASAIMGISVVWIGSLSETLLAGDTVIFQALRLILSVSVGSIVYLIAAYLLKIEEMRMALGMLKKFDPRKFSKV